MKSLMSTAILLFSFVLSACTATRPVIGHYNDYNEVFSGTVQANTANGSAYIEVKSKRSNVTCSGPSVVTHIPGYAYIIPTCNGQKGVVMMNCEDGRMLKAEWAASGCGSGKGVGSDQFGNSFIFEWGMPIEEADQMLVKVETTQQAKPDFPKLKRVVMEQRDAVETQSTATTK